MRTPILGWAFPDTGAQVTRGEASVNLVSNSSSPVVEETPRVSGSGLHVSRRFDSTPAVERHRSVGPEGRSGRATPSSGGSAGGNSPQGVSSPEFREYEGDAVPGGQLTLDLIAAHNIDFPDSMVRVSDF